MIKERNNLGDSACISLTHGRALGAGVIRDAGPVQRGVDTETEAVSQPATNPGPAHSHAG